MACLRFDQFPGYVTRDLNGFGNSSPLRNEPLDVVGSCQIETFRQLFDVYRDQFFHEYSFEIVTCHRYNSLHIVFSWKYDSSTEVGVALRLKVAQDG